MRISGITYVPRRTHKVRNSVVTLCIFILILINIVMFISAFAAWKFIHPERASIPTFSSNILPEYQKISFNSKDEGIALKGWYFKSKDSGKTVILVHGLGQNRLPFQEQTLDIIKGFLNKEYNVLALDLRNSGESSGDISALGLSEKNDVLSAIQYAKSLGAKRIILTGYSTGASASLLAAAVTPEVSAVIADTPYSDLKEFLDETLSLQTHLPPIPFTSTTGFCLKLLLHLDFEQASPEKVVDKFAAKPVFLIHSRNDSFIPVQNSRKLYSALSAVSKSTVEYWETEPSGNAASYLANRKEYIERIAAFLEKVDKSGSKANK